MALVGISRLTTYIHDEMGKIKKKLDNVAIANALQL